MMQATGTVSSVLLVEDDIALAYGWAHELEGRGYGVRHFVDVESAFRNCMEQWPDAVIVDAFFRSSTMFAENLGGTSFCSTLFTHLRKTGQRLPFIMGVSGALGQGEPRGCVFSDVPRSLMPVRMQKPVTGAQLADQLDQAWIKSDLDDRAQLNFAF